ncbi:hypothetical protein CDAR_610891, partial [Caerostris darwini]
ARSAAPRVLRTRCIHKFWITRSWCTCPNGVVDRLSTLHSHPPLILGGVSIAPGPKLNPFSIHR